MGTWTNLVCFARSAEHLSFSEAARRLSLTPAAVSRNVGLLERGLGVRLFHRSTRRLTLTEAGETFRAAISDGFEALQTAMAGISGDNGDPAGVLKVSLAPTFGTAHILPLLPGFLTRYPTIRPEWHFENRPVDLIAEGYDAAIGGGFELSAGLVTRALAPAHIVAVAAPDYARRCGDPADPAGLAGLRGIVMRSRQTGRVRHWTMRNSTGAERSAALLETIILDDPNAMRDAALLGLGVAMLAVPDVMPLLKTGRLVRLVPEWFADAGTISIYYASKSLLPGKTRAFVDWVANAFEARRLAAIWSDLATNGGSA